MTPEQIQALKSKLAQMDEADVDQEADESVFEDEDIVTDTSADGKSASGGESQTVDIKIEAEDDKEESLNQNGQPPEGDDSGTEEVQDHAWTYTRKIQTYIAGAGTYLN